jgi:hypothetical protein
VVIPEPAGIERVAHATAVSGIDESGRGTDMGMNGGTDWSEQITFLTSPTGRAYAAKVETTLVEQIKRGYRG